jgi:hypothetical protein
MASVCPSTRSTNCIEWAAVWQIAPQNVEAAFDAGRRSPDAESGEAGRFIAEVLNLGRVSALPVAPWTAPLQTEW